ncbi:hypothetical protein Zmor_019665 [Zophobas morio]|uniref:Uncharacterized protein n=1 Tax=Zophobas morio TaxID=2755281 RepID=A0AA38I276_9CUCU|nr:hypothetical protein Zmor_019665 [Zophobas morio]
MGNDIKLPVSRRTQLLESQKALQADARALIILEIQKISNQLETIDNQIQRVERNIAQINQNNEYYKRTIQDLSKTLHQLNIECLNEKLSDERFMETTNAHLQDLEEPNNYETAPILDEYSSAKIATLQSSVDALNATITTNQDYIEKIITKVTQN